MLKREKNILKSNSMRSFVRSFHCVCSFLYAISLIESDVLRLSGLSGTFVLSDCLRDDDR